MAINRFYQPSRGQYQSQFVPEQLPAELMMGVLGSKQKQYNDLSEKIQTNIYDWNQEALPGFDTQYRDKIRKENEAWADQMMMKDLSQPETVRDYVGRVRMLRDNKDLEAIKSAYATHQSELKRIEELKKGDPFNYDPALEHDYLQRYREYTSGQGKGFQGSIKLGDPMVDKGTDILKETEAYFDQAKASGYDVVKFLSQDLAYNEGYKSNSKKIDEIMGADPNNPEVSLAQMFLNSPTGKQLAKRYDQQVFPNQVPSIGYQNLTKEQKEEYDRGRTSYVLREFQRVGNSFKFSEATSNADQAYRMRYQEGRADNRANPVSNLFTVAGTNEGLALDYNKDSDKFNQRTSRLAELDNILNMWDKAHTNPTTNQEFTIGKLPPEKKKELEFERSKLMGEQRLYNENKTNAIADALVQLNPKIDKQYVKDAMEFMNKTSGQRQSAWGDGVLVWEDKLLDILKNGQYTTIKGETGEKNKGVQLFFKELKENNPNKKEQIKILEQKYEIASTLFTGAGIPEKTFAEKLGGSVGSALTWSMKESFKKVKEIKESNISNNFELKLQEKIKENYNNSGTIEHNALLRSPDKVNIWNESTGGFESTTSAHKMMEEFMQTSPESFTWFDEEGKLIRDPRTWNNQTQGAITISSEDTDRLNNPNPVFTVSVYENKWNPFIQKNQPVRKTYTVRADNVRTNEYNKARSRELYSMWRADPESYQGKLAYAKAVEYENPEVGMVINKAALLNDGETTRVSHNIAGNDYEFIIRKPIHGQGSYFVKAIDKSTGVESGKEYTYNNLEELSKFFNLNSVLR